MKKIVACLLVVLLLGTAAVYVVNMPEFTLYRMMKDTQENGFEALEPYLSRELQPMFQTAMRLSSQPWLLGLLNNDATQELISLLRSEAAMTWDLEEVRRGSSTASCLVGVQSSAFDAKISLEMIRQDGRWLINSLTLPAFHLK